MADNVEGPEERPAILKTFQAPSLLELGDPDTEPAPPTALDEPVGKR